MLRWVLLESSRPATVQVRPLLLNAGLCLSVEGLCGWLWVGVDLSSESFCSPPFWPVFRRFARRVFSTPGLCWRTIYERRGVWRAWASPIPETTNVCGACPSPPSRPDGPPAATKHHTHTDDRPTGGPPARSIPSQAVAGGRGQTCRCALPQATGFRPYCATKLRAAPRRLAPSLESSEYQQHLSVDCAGGSTATMSLSTLSKWMDGVVHRQWTSSISLPSAAAGALSLPEPSKMRTFGLEINRRPHNRPIDEGFVECRWPTRHGPQGREVLSAISQRMHHDACPEVVLIWRVARRLAKPLAPWAPSHCSTQLGLRCEQCRSAFLAIYTQRLAGEADLSTLSLMHTIDACGRGRHLGQSRLDSIASGHAYGTKLT